MSKGKSKLLAVLFGLLFVAWGVTRWERATAFDAECSVHVLNAANTDDPALAAQELGKAIGYLEQQRLTKGSTAWFNMRSRPDQDLAIWYQNLQWHQGLIQGIASDATEETRAETIAAVRKDLIRHAENGDKANAPDGISVYPYGGWFALWGATSFILAMVFGFASMRELKHSATETEEEEELIPCARR